MGTITLNEIVLLIGLALNFFKLVEISNKQESRLTAIETKLLFILGERVKHESAKE